MTEPLALRNVMSGWPKARREGRRLFVTTHCMYPSNSFVTVVVEAGKEEFTASDNGGAVSVVQLSGVHVNIKRADNIIRGIVRPQGLGVENGIIYSHVVNRKAMPGIIALVANASKDAASAMLHHFGAPMRRNIRAELERILDVKYHGRFEKNTQVAGASTKTHKFDYIIHLSDDRQLLLDAVTNDTSAINARVVANIDVQQARHPNITQRIVYDETEKWSSANLRLLQVGATIVPFGSIAGVLERIAA